MRKYNLFGYATLAVIIVLVLANTAAAQYWFQTGVRGAQSTNFNNGAGVTIQTVYQNATNGSIGFWVGEDLSNGAFIQVGYEITNTSGYYSSSCTNNTKSVFLHAGIPTWFWEYFPVGANNNEFCGGIGENGSVGQAGKFNSYSFRSTGDVWSAYFNNNLIGSVDLGASNSGQNPPSVFAEYADTNTNEWPLKNVTFKDMLYYIGNVSRLVPQGYAAVSYGKGSLTALPNPYGIKEVGNFADYFEVGSGISQTQGPARLWQIGYTVTIYSPYGNLTGSNNYLVYSNVSLTAPPAINISKGVREQFVGWVGNGQNSYTGINSTQNVTLYNNITETALWQKQYYLNVSTQYGSAIGEGWYDVNTTAKVSIASNIVSTGTGSRAVFAGWNNSVTSNKTTVYLDSPKTLRATWGQQYYLNATTQHGNTTGSGWYDSGSMASVSLSMPVVPVNGTTRFAFRQWSNGATTANLRLPVYAPTTLNAIYDRQYLVTFVPQDTYGQNLTGVDYYNVSSQKANSTLFVFPFTVYNIEYIYYKGVPITVDHAFTVDNPTTLTFRSPVYNVAIKAQSVFGTPVNASLNITFKNNTNVMTSLGNNGTKSFYDVPYGYITGYAQYFGLRQSTNLAYGADSDLTFFTASLVAFIIFGVALIVAVAKIAERYESRRKFEAKRRSNK